MSANNSFKKNFINVLFFKFVVAALKLAIGVLTARFLGPTSKGIFVAITRLPGLAVTISALSIGDGIIFNVGNKKIPLNKVFGSAAVFILIFSVITTLALLIFRSFFLEQFFSEIDHSYYNFILILVPLLTINYFVSISFQALQRFRSYNFISSFTFALIFVTLVMGFLLIDTTVEVALWCYVIALTIIPIISLTLLWKHSESKVSVAWSAFPSTTKFGVKSHFGSVFTQLEYQFDIFFLLYYLPPAAVGIYSVGTTICQLLWYITNALNTALFPRIASTNENKHSVVLMQKALRHMVFASIIISIGLVAVAYPLIKFLYGAAFIESYFVFLVLMPAILGDVVFRSLFSWFKGSGRPEIVSALSGSSLLLNVALNLYLIPIYGVYGAALSSVISYNARAFILLMIFLKKTSTLPSQALIIKKAEVRDAIILLKGIVLKLRKENKG